MVVWFCPTGIRPSRDDDVSQAALARPPKQERLRSFEGRQFGRDVAGALVGQKALGRGQRDACDEPENDWALQTAERDQSNTLFRVPPEPLGLSRMGQRRGCLQPVVHDLEGGPVVGVLEAPGCDQALLRALQGP